MWTFRSHKSMHLSLIPLSYCCAGLEAFMSGWLSPHATALFHIIFQVPYVTPLCL